MSSTEYISGYFKVIDRLPAGMNVPDYLEYHSFDPIFTNHGNDRFTLEYDPTFMNRKIEFKLGEEVEEVHESGEKYKTKFTALPDFHLIQESVGQNGNHYKIIRKFNERAVDLYLPGQIVMLMNMEHNGIMLPWNFVLIPSNKPVARWIITRNP